MKAVARWGVWRYVKMKNREKPAKIPFSVRVKQEAHTNNPDEWVPFDEAVKAYEAGRFDGLAFLFLDSGFFGVDIDRCIDGCIDGLTGELSALAVDVLAALPDCHVEYSPSGAGLHIIGRGTVPKDKNDQKLGLEMYSRAHYFTVTGCAYAGAVNPTVDRTDAVRAVYDKYWSVDKPAPDTAPHTPERRFTNEQIIKYALESKTAERFKALWEGKWQSYEEYPSQSEADLAACILFAFWTGKNPEQMDELFRASTLMRPKWDVVRHSTGETYGEGTIAKAIERCENVHDVYKSHAGDFAEPSDGIQFYKGKAFQHHVMGDYLIEELGACKINGVLHIYQDGTYSPGEECIQGCMLSLLPALPYSKRVEVIRYLKAYQGTPTRETSPPRYIPFADNIYDIDDDCFIEYSPDFVFLNRFPYNYKPDAPPQAIMTDAIERIAEGDAEVVQLIYEVAGSVFYRSNMYRGSALLHGTSGNNGKTTLLNMLRQAVGHENTSSLTIQDIGERFRLAELYGKAANIGDDIPATYIQDSSNFKKAVTGEHMTAEKKGQDPFAFKPYAKHFFAANTLPRANDKTKAFYSRLKIIPLMHDFSKDIDLNVKLHDRLWTDAEMEYFVKLAVEAMRGVINRGRFISPQVVATALHDYEIENEPALAFLLEYGEVEGQQAPEVYGKYKDWCWENEYKPCSNTSFSQMVRREKGLAVEPVWWPELKKKVRTFVKPKRKHT